LVKISNSAVVLVQENKTETSPNPLVVFPRARKKNADEDDCKLLALDWECEFLYWEVQGAGAMPPAVQGCQPRDTDICKVLKHI
jgi:hypothetical protein